ncbi:MAG: hypothetical protein WC335_01705 [Candidatus Omnitrophota bacterium]|jgi:hypothetical protein
MHKNRNRFTPLEKATDFSRWYADFYADGGLMPPSAKTVRGQSSLTGFTPKFLLALITALTVFSVLSFAQNRTAYRQETANLSCSTENPRYCQECKDPDKRDFAQCDEVDYRKVDLLKSGRLPDSPPYLSPDRENGAQRVVFAANIGNKNLKSEIFIADADDHSGTQKRLSWDGGAAQVNLDPFFTVDKKVAYTSIDTRKKTENYFVIEDIRNGKKTKITREQSDSLYLAAHKDPERK